MNKYSAFAETPSDREQTMSPGNADIMLNQLGLNPILSELEAK